MSSHTQFILARSNMSRLFSSLLVFAREIDAFLGAGVVAVAAVVSSRKEWEAASAEEVLGVVSSSQLPLDEVDETTEKERSEMN
jgi:hypothetical protein